MLSTKNTATVVGLDIEGDSIAAAEVSVNGPPSLRAGAVSALEAGITREGEVADPAALAAALKQLFAEHKLAKNVRLGVSNQRVVVRTLRLPLIEKKAELETAIRFQAQDSVPMPLEQATLDWQVVAKGVGEGGMQMDVVVVAARRDMITAMTTALRDAGLRPVGIDLAAFGMIRALAPEDSGAQDHAAATLSYEERLAANADGEVVEDALPVSPAKLYCSLGDVTNLAVAQGAACQFTRLSSFGVEDIAERLAERRGLTSDHARQWLTHVGLERPVETVEGDPETVLGAREALVDGVARLADELRLSIDYYGAQEGAAVIDEVIVCGTGTTIAGLTTQLEQALGYPFTTARPAALAHLDDASAARLTLPYGLGLNE